MHSREVFATEVLRSETAQSTVELLLIDWPSLLLRGHLSSQKKLPLDIQCSSGYPFTH